MRPLFFVHVPKTAGTSLRLGLSDTLGADRIAYDYGDGNPHTTPIVQQHIHDEQDAWAFFKAAESAGVALVAGHVSVSRFVLGYGIRNTIIFLRNPLQRMASEHLHWVRHKNYKGSFKEFFQARHRQDKQLKALGGAPLEALGFFGLTERYSESLRLLNAITGLNIPPREDNKFRSSFASLHELSAHEVKALRTLNKMDIRLYTAAQGLFEQRLGLFRSGRPYAHAKLTRVNGTEVSGWAWWADNHDMPVEVEILINGESVALCKATDFTPALCQFSPPRGAYVGFSQRLRLKPNDQVQCRVPSTGQLFPLEPQAADPSQSGPRTQGGNQKKDSAS